MSASRYPSTRLRRNRRDDWTRRLVAETRLSVDDLIWPVFLIEGEGRTTSVESMPGVSRVTLDRLAGVRGAGGKARHSRHRAVSQCPGGPEGPGGERGAESRQPDVPRRTIAAPGIPRPSAWSGDVALDCYTSHGHDGVIRDGYVHNDDSVAVLTRQAVHQAQAGITVIAPSDMMDGRIGAIRTALDENGLIDTRIMSYAVKYASAFYGPFRDAVGTGNALKGDKKTYQMNPANTDEAFREVKQDLAEGADMVMVKPGMPYLDVVRRVHDHFGVPTFAYQVSGEYAMIAGAAERGWIDGERAMLESLLGFKRAGAAGVLTYFAVAAATILRG